MMLKVQLALLLTVGLAAGCGEVAVFGHTIGEKRTTSEVKTDSTTTQEVVAGQGIQRVQTVTVVLTPQANANVVNDSRFEVEALLDAIKRELRSRKLLDDTDPLASRTAEISIDHFGVQPTSNAVLFGRIIGAGTISGDLRVRDTLGNELQSLRIEAEARVSTNASGQTANPLEPLYRRFAVLAGNSLAGTSAPALDQPRR